MKMMGNDRPHGRLVLAGPAGMNDPGVSPGEIGGIFAGIIALLAAIGKGLQWLLNWKDARENTRSAKLDRWHRELLAREAHLAREQTAYQQRIEDRLEVIDTQNQALRIAFDLVAGKLRKVAPEDAALVQAEQLLAAAFPLVPKIPRGMSAKLAEIEDPQGGDVQ